MKIQGNSIQLFSILLQLQEKFTKKLLYFQVKTVDLPWIFICDLFNVLFVYTFQSFDFYIYIFVYFVFYVVHFFRLSFLYFHSFSRLFL